jgi:hypothetical protein
MTGGIQLKLRPYEKKEVCKSVASIAGRRKFLPSCRGFRLFLKRKVQHENIFIYFWQKNEAH